MERHSEIVRQWRLLLALEGKSRGMTLSEAQGEAGDGVSDRTIRRDFEALRLAAHGLKGAIATVGGSAGREAAATIEQAARANSIADSELACATLREEIGRLEKAFTSAGLISRPRVRSTARRKPRPPKRKRRTS